MFESLATGFRRCDELLMFSSKLPTSSFRRRPESRGFRHSGAGRNPEVFVIPAQAGIQRFSSFRRRPESRSVRHSGTGRNPEESKSSAAGAVPSKASAPRFPAMRAIDGLRIRSAALAWVRCRVSPPGSLTTQAKLFMSGRSQAIRLPAKLRIGASEVDIEQIGQALWVRPQDDAADNMAVWLEAF